MADEGEGTNNWTTSSLDSLVQRVILHPGFREAVNPGFNVCIEQTAVSSSSPGRSQSGSASLSNRVSAATGTTNTSTLTRPNVAKCERETNFSDSFSMCENTEARTAAVVSQRKCYIPSFFYKNQ